MSDGNEVSRDLVIHLDAKILRKMIAEYGEGAIDEFGEEAKQYVMRQIKDLLENSIQSQGMLN